MGVCPNYLEQNHEPFISRTKRVGNGAQSRDFAAKEQVKPTALCVARRGSSISSPDGAQKRGLRTGEFGATFRHAVQPSVDKPPSLLPRMTIGHGCPLFNCLSRGLVYNYFVQEFQPLGRNERPWLINAQ